MGMTTCAQEEDKYTAEISLSLPANVYILSISVLLLLFKMRIYFHLFLSGLTTAFSLKVFPEKMEKDVIRSQTALCGHKKKKKGRVNYLPCIENILFFPFLTDKRHPKLSNEHSAATVVSVQGLMAQYIVIISNQLLYCNTQWHNGLEGF